MCLVPARAQTRVSPIEAPRAAAAHAVPETAGSICHTPPGQKCCSISDHRHTTSTFPNAQDFASGYALGEVLSRHNLQPDFDKFETCGTPGAAINNCTRLQPTSKLGLKLGNRYDLPRGAGVASTFSTDQPPAPAAVFYFCGSPAVCMSGAMSCAAQTHS
jgi:hypothetical protein